MYDITDGAGNRILLADLVASTEDLNINLDVLLWMKRETAKAADHAAMTRDTRGLVDALRLLLDVDRMISEECDALHSEAVREVRSERAKRRIEWVK